MFEKFLTRLAQLTQRDHEVWIGGQRYIRLDQVHEAVQWARRQAEATKVSSGCSD